MQPVLVVEHEEQCPPAWMGEWLTEAGCRLDVRRPYRGDALPENLGAHGALVVLGGSMGANDDADYPWLTQVKRLVQAAVVDSTPTLGICLGHQLVNVALGGSVHRNPLGQQIGVLPVGWIPAADKDPLFSSLTGLDVAAQWNDDIVHTLPDGAVVLAATPRGEVQAAAFAPRVWGVQWHPELGEDIVARWADDDRDAVQERSVDVDAKVAEIGAAHAKLRRWRALANRFAELSSHVEAAQWRG